MIWNPDDYSVEDLVVLLSEKVSLNCLVLEKIILTKQKTEYFV